MLVAVFMELMDVTMANVAVPAIRTDLGASSGQAQWVVAGYSLAFAVGLLTGGRLGDIWGRKRVFMAGLAAFIAASLLSGLAPGPAFLIGSRVLQGLAAAVMLPQVLASITVWFPAGKREAAFGLVGAVTGLGGVVSPLIGGALISADVLSLGWRPIFLINIPIGLAALAAARVYVADSVAPARPRLDVGGAVVSALGMFLLVFPVIQGHEEGWPAWGWVMLGLAVPVLGAFAVMERRRARRGKPVLTDLSLFRGRTFSAGLGITVVFFGGVTATAFILMIYLQSGFGYSPFRAGLSLVPLALALIVGSGLSIGASRRLGRTILQIGCLVAAGGLIWLAAVAASHATSLGIWDIVPPLAVFGLGLGLTVAPLTDFVLAGVPEPSAGSASGLQASMVQVGNSVGVAVLGTIFFTLLARHAAAVAMHDTLYYDAGVFVIAAALMFLLSPDAGKQRLAAGSSPVPARPGMVRGDVDLAIMIAAHNAGVYKNAVSDPAKLTGERTRERDG
jgi:EmrB/QacA subfamily drug resistance transporter